MYPHGFRVLNDAQIDEFIRLNFDNSTYDAFQILPLNVMKADFFRYAVLQAKGGVYADVDVAYLSELRRASSSA